MKFIFYTIPSALARHLATENKMLHGLNFVRQIAVEFTSFSKFSLKNGACLGRQQLKLTHLKTIFNLCFMSVDSGFSRVSILNVTFSNRHYNVFIKQQKANPGVSKDVIILSGSKFSSSKVGWYSVYQDQTQDLVQCLH